MSKHPIYVETPAKSLIGQRMLIVEGHLDADKKLRVHAQLKRKRDRFVCFRAGVVVRQQLEGQRFFPVWARLHVVKGKVHEYYKLDLATTTQVSGGQGKGKRKRWKVALDAETQSWKGESHELA
jgi:hypothetical protein